MAWKPSNLVRFILFYFWVEYYQLIVLSGDGGDSFIGVRTEGIKQAG
jgi:hypothetical protein